MFSGETTSTYVPKGARTSGKERREGLRAALGGGICILDESLADIEAGRTISDEDMWHEYDKEIEKENIHRRFWGHSQRAGVTS